MEALDHILELYNEGIELPADLINKLQVAGKIERLNIDTVPIRQTGLTVDYYRGDKTAKEEYIDRIVEVILNNRTIFYGVDGSKVNKADWDIFPDKQNPPKELISWINSINSGWLNKKVFVPFNYYCAQADYWMAQNYSIKNCTTHEQQFSFATEEIQRIKENSLYYIKKYGYLKDGDSDDDEGMQQIEPYECQKVICYLFDLRASFMLLKARQIGMTSVLGILFGKRAKFNKNYFIKFVTENGDKAIEIFRDKIKFPLFNLPEWMDTSVTSDSQTSLSYGIKEGKGKFTFTGGSLVTEAPYPTVINGGSPQLVGLDEAGNMPEIGEIMDQARPTLWRFDKNTRSLKFRRQIIAWGTGGDMDAGGGAYEVEFRSAWNSWNNGNYNIGIIPLFFDCYAKDGITDEFLQAEMEFHYSKSGAEGEKSKIIYHQSYPRTIDDAFLRSSDTFIPISIINKNLERIHSLAEEQMFGEFSPRWSDQNPNPLISETTLVGNVWEPMDELFAPCQIFKHPEPYWKHRYFMGVDPIDTTSGTSNFAAAIWDNYANTIAAVIDFRKPNYKECYLQALMMAMYYDAQILFESNRGTAFKDFAILKGFQEMLVYNKSLPGYLVTLNSNEIYGVDTKGKRASHMLNKLQELCDQHLENIWIERFFIQMKTFVRKEKQDGSSSFKVDDHKYFYDDVIDAVNLAYINALSSERDPIYTKDIPKKRKEMRYVRDAMGNLDLMEVSVENRVY